MSSMPGTMPHASHRLSLLSLTAPTPDTHHHQVHFPQEESTVSLGAAPLCQQAPAPLQQMVKGPSMELGHSRQRQAPPSTSAGTLFLLRGNSAYLKSCCKQ